MDFPVPQNMRDCAGVVRATPQELVQNRSLVRQTTKEIGDGVQHVPSKRMPERHRDSNINCLDKYNMPCAGVVSDMIPAGFVRVADVFRPLSHGRTRDVSVKKEIAVKKGPKRVFVDSGRPTRLRGRLRRCLISMSTWLSLAIMWCPTPKVWTSTRCLDLEMFWCLCPRSTRAPWQ